MQRRYYPYLYHHGIKGQKWGVRNGPPYPLDSSKKHDTIVADAIESGLVSKKVNREKQLRHTKHGHIPGRSYLDGDLEYAQELVDKLSGTGEALINGKTGEWLRKEKVISPHIIGTHVDLEGVETKTNKAMISYSKTGNTYLSTKGERVMKLSRALEGKNIRIVDTDNEVFTGKVTDYIYPEDNEPEGVAAIAIKNCPQRSGQWVGFNETDIKSIEIID